jgi:hypothetical protein
MIKLNLIFFMDLKNFERDIILMFANLFIESTSNQRYKGF